MSTVGFEIGLLLALILLNGALSMSEIAIVSARKARLQRRAEEGDRKARAALEFARNPDPMLSTVQVGITLVGILAGAFGGATLAQHLAHWLGGFTGLEASSETIAVVLVVLVITFLTVVLGELVPKRLALSRPEDIASHVAGPMRLLSRLAAPMVRLLSASTNLVLWVLRVKPSAEPPITEDEIRVLMRQGTKAGQFEEAERSMVDRVFRLGDLRTSGLMTPRTESVWVDLDDPVEESLAKMSRSGHSHFPVCQGNRDQIIGVVSIKQLWARALEGEPHDLRSAVLKPLFVPGSVPALKLLELYKQAGTHIALVVDEYGGFQGIVTLNDVLGAVVGDVTWADVEEDALAIQREDGSWLLDGLLPIDEFKSLFHLRHLPGEEEGEYHTVGGFVMSRLGRIPHEGEHFEWKRLRLEVVDMDERRIDKVLVTQTPEPPADTDGAD